MIIIMYLFKIILKMEYFIMYQLWPFDLLFDLWLTIVLVRILILSMEVFVFIF